MLLTVISNIYKVLLVTQMERDMTDPIQSPAQFAATLYEAGYRATSRSDSDLIVEGIKTHYGFLNSDYVLEVLDELEKYEAAA